MRPASLHTPNFSPPPHKTSRTTCRGAALLRPSYSGASKKGFFLNFHSGRCSASLKWLRHLSVPRSCEKFVLNLPPSLPAWLPRHAFPTSIPKTPDDFRLFPQLIRMLSIR